MGTPSDWVSGERVFAPPTGTFDVDWLVPAVVEAVPGTTPAAARAVLLQARQGRTARRDGTPGGARADDDPVRAVAERVVDEALRTFGA